jgi:hypothetical protein
LNGCIVTKSKFHLIHSGLGFSTLNPEPLNLGLNQSQGRWSEMEAKGRAKFVNCVNADQLFSTLDLIKQNPEIARFKFRAVNRWIKGTQKYSPVFNTITKSAPVSVRLEK